jgi:hypothetical protein
MNDRTIIFKPTASRACGQKETIMHKVLAYALLVIGVSSFAMGAPVPEIGPASAGSALALLSGAVLVIRGRRKK